MYYKIEYYCSTLVSITSLQILHVTLCDSRNYFSNSRSSGDTIVSVVFGIFGTQFPCSSPSQLLSMSVILDLSISVFATISGYISSSANFSFQFYFYASYFNLISSRRPTPIGALVSPIFIRRPCLSYFIFLFPLPPSFLIIFSPVFGLSLPFLSFLLSCLCSFSFSFSFSFFFFP